MNIIFGILATVIVLWMATKFYELIRSLKVLEAFFNRSTAFLGVAEISGDKTVHINRNRALGVFLKQDLLKIKREPLEEIGFSMEFVERLRSEALNSKKLKASITFTHGLNGRDFFVSVSSLPPRGNRRLRFTYGLEDITEETKSFKILSENEERLKYALEASHDGLWDWDIENKTLYFSSRWSSITGHEMKDPKATLDFWSSLIHPDDLPGLVTQYLLHEQGKTPQYRAEYRYKNKNGQWHWILDRGKIIHRDPLTNRPLRMVGTHKDLSERKELEETLRKNEQKLKDIMNFAPIGIFTFDESGKLLFTNFGWHDITGPSDRDLMNNWMTIVADEDSEFVKKNWMNSQGFEFRMNLVSGNDKRVFCKIKRIEGNDGDLLHYLGCIQDISSYRELQIQTDFYQMALDKTAIVATTDANGTITYVNDKLCEISGYSRAELIGRTHRILNSGQMPEGFFHEMWKTISEGKVWRGEICNKAKDGTFYWVDTTIVPQLTEKGELYQYTAIRQEITERKKLEAKLLEANKATLAASRAKSDFLANISHEIRTPMNGIIGMCNLIKTDVTDADVLEKLNVIQQSGKTLLRLINDILDFSKIEVGKIELESEPFKLEECIDDVVSLLTPLADQKGLDLTYVEDNRIPPILNGDRTRLSQILMNLIGNAIKFTSHGRISVTANLRSKREEVCVVQVDVQDTGIGIPEDSLGRLFSSFTQVDASTTRKYGGSGLGLAISKGLCERMGGEIWVSSKVNQGSTFSFTIKVTSAEAVKDEKPEIIATLIPHHHPLRILVAEDNRTNQLVLCGLLEKLGYNALVASNGLMVLEILEKNSFDLIFMDCHMPSLDGLEATKIIRTNRGFAQPRIVAVTANAHKEEHERCLAAGMNGVLLKPVIVDELIKVLKNFEPAERPDATPHSKEQIVDLRAFYKNFEGYEDIAEKMIEEFLSSLPTLLEKMELAILRGNARDIELAAHTFKGAVSNFHATRAVDTSSALENMGSCGELVLASGQYQLVKSEADKVRKQLEQHSRKKEVA